VAFADTLSVFRPIGGKEREKKRRREEKSRATASTLSLDLYALKF
jgi:hypothetical protein